MRPFTIALILALVGCSNSSTPSNPPSEKQLILNISNLKILNEEMPEFGILGNSTPSKKELSLKVKIINDEAVPIEGLVVSIQGTGFSIKSNRCPNILEVEKSCEVAISFKNRQLYNGNYFGSLSVKNQEVIQLQASVEGIENPALTGVAVLEITQSAPFNQNGLSYRTLSIKNTGTGVATNLSTNIELSSDYRIRINRCPSTLNPGGSCSIQVQYIYFRNANLAPPFFKMNINVDSPSGEVKKRMELQSGEEVLLPAPTSFSMSENREEFIITGSNFKFVTSVRILDGSEDIDELILATVQDGQIVAKPSKNISLKNKKEYTFRID